VVLYNSLPHDRQEVVRVWVSVAPVSVFDLNDQPVICQLSPFFDDEGAEMSTAVYKVIIKYTLEI